MRKRNISFLFDKFLWFIMLILPLIFAMLFSIRINAQDLVETVSDSKYSRFENYNEIEFERNGFHKDLYITPEFIDTFYLTFNCYNIDRDYFLYDTEISFYFVYDGVKYLYNTTLQGASGSKGYFMIDDIYTFAFWQSGQYIEFLTGYVDTDYYTFNEWLNTIYYGWFNGEAFYLHLDIDVYLPNGLFGYNFEYLSYLSDINFSYISYFESLNYCLDKWLIFGSDDFVYRGYNQLFGNDGLVPIFYNYSFIPKYFSYMTWIIFLHVVFDFIVFVPRLAHKWMGNLYKDNE